MRPPDKAEVKEKCVCCGRPTEFRSENEAVCLSCYSDGKHLDYMAEKILREVKREERRKEDLISITHEPRLLREEE